MDSLKGSFSAAGAAIESVGKTAMGYIADGLEVASHKLDDIASSFRNASRDEPVGPVTDPSLAARAAAKNSKHFTPKPFEI